MLAAMLEHAPEVADLTLLYCQLTQLPAVVVCRRGLTSLSLSYNQLSDVPPGDWLAGEGYWLASLGVGACVHVAADRSVIRPNPHASCPIADLRSLHLSSNLLARLPPALSAATALTELCLRGNSGMKLKRADAQLLAALPIDKREVERLDPRSSAYQKCTEFAMGAMVLLAVLTFLAIWLGRLH